MRIAIQTLGTRGDLQPYLALALGLETRGHEVQLSGPEQFEQRAREVGVRYAPLPGEFLALLQSDEGRAAVAGGKGFSAGLRLLKYVRPLMRRLLNAEWDAVRSFAPRVVVHHPKSLAAPHIAEKLSCPAVLASPIPGFTPTTEFPTPLLPFDSLGPFNRVSHQLAIRAGDLLFSNEISTWRATTMGPSSRRGRARKAAATLYAYSEHVLPAPADWGQDVHVCGYWFHDTHSWQIPAPLKSFLAAGDTPIYIGFGSMPGVDAERFTRQLLDGLDSAGRRALIGVGGGAMVLKNPPPHVFVLDEAPHDQLFRHVSATLHHGGAGTTAASLRAGLPTIICPFFGDQPFWGRRVAALGVGPAPLDRRQLSTSAIASAIRETESAQMRQRARELGLKIRSEDGVGRAVSVIERHSGDGMADVRRTTPS